MVLRLPQTADHMTVGLMGGSFDPAHHGHVHSTKEALKRFGLDQVWWLVSPGNPLKPDAPAALVRRMCHARALMAHPRVVISDLEARIKTRYTADTLRHLTKARPRVRFVWLMGADNLVQLHRWQDWRWIMDHVPVGVLARPGQRLAALTSPAAQIYRPHRLKLGASRALPWSVAPVWCFLNVPMVDASSSKLRAVGQWRR